MEKVVLSTPTIKLGQLLKLVHVVPSGGAQKSFLEKNGVLVNGVLEQRRGRKLNIGDKVKIGSREFVLAAE